MQERSTHGPALTRIRPPLAPPLPLQRLDPTAYSSLRSGPEEGGAAVELSSKAGAESVQ